MSIKIEVIKENATGTRVAYYFRIPAGKILTGAARMERTPKGTALSVQEIADLKAGSIMELTVKYTFEEMKALNVAGKKSMFIAEWDRLKLLSLNKYRDRYELVGSYFDGTWTIGSKP